MAAVKKEKLSTIISFLGQSGSGENLSSRITLFTPVDRNQIMKFAFNWGVVARRDTGRFPGGPLTSQYVKPR